MTPQRTCVEGPWQHNLCICLYTLLLPTSFCVQWNLHRHLMLVHYYMFYEVIVSPEVILPHYPMYINLGFSNLGAVRLWAIIPTPRIEFVRHQIIYIVSTCMDRNKELWIESEPFHPSSLGPGHCPKYPRESPIPALMMTKNRSWCIHAWDRTGPALGPVDVTESQESAPGIKAWWFMLVLVFSLLCGKDLGEW